MNWKDLLSFFKELWLFPLIGILAVYGSLLLFTHLTGRSTIDDPATIVSATYNFAILLLAGIFVSQVDGHLFNDLTKDEYLKAPLWTQFLDVLKTLVLLGTSLYVLLH